MVTDSIIIYFREAFDFITLFHNCGLRWLGLNKTGGSVNITIKNFVERPWQLTFELKYRL